MGHTDPAALPSASHEETRKADDFTIEVAGVAIKTADAADSARFTAHPNGVVVRTNTPEQGGGFSAWVGTVHSSTAEVVVPGQFPEIPAVGTGATEAEAVLSLAGLLADFVRGHKKRIDELESKLESTVASSTPQA